MPSLTYTGEPDRVYPFLGLEPVPGETYDVAEDPEDGRWASPRTNAAKEAKAAAPAPDPTPEPSVPAEPTTTTTEA